MEIHEEEWEIINDDGFIYKRQRLNTDPTTTSSATMPPDPAAEERNRKERKKTILIKLKARYHQEIDQWELLSNTLKALQHRPQIQTPPPPTVSLDLPAALSPEHASDLAYRQVVETLLIQVEAQEESIKEILTLCDVAEALCSAQEQLLKQPFVYLPIWESSPRKLITSLCEES